jgi:protein involved in polysaccharide export with SLBB domain
MEAGESKCFRQRGKHGLLTLWLVVMSGCALSRPHVDRALLTGREETTARYESVAGKYAVRCPDLVDISVDDRPDLSGLHEIDVDGRLKLGSQGRILIEGLTVSEIAHRLAEALQIPDSAVQVRVAEYRSQQVFLIGQVVGLQRSVAYEGPETVVDLLRRVGGITPGAAARDVYVVRAGIPEGRQPQVFHVDLPAIVIRHDERTNVTLQPLDQVFVGETRKFSVEKCVPPWLRPAYELVCGLKRRPTQDESRARSDKTPPAPIQITQGSSL